MTCRHGLLAASVSNDRPPLTQRRIAIPVSISNAELLAAITTNFDKLLADLSKVSDDRARKRTLDGHAAGTTMSPADLVSYLVGWNEFVLKWLVQDDRGVKVDFPETRFKWNQLGLLAQEFYEVLRGYNAAGGCLTPHPEA